MPLEAGLVPALMRLAEQVHRGCSRVLPGACRDGEAGSRGRTRSGAGHSAVKSPDPPHCRIKQTLIFCGVSPCERHVLCGAMLYISGIDEFEGPAQRQQMLEALATFRGTALLAGKRARDFLQAARSRRWRSNLRRRSIHRAALWRASLKGFSQTVDPTTVETLPGALSSTRKYTQAVVSATMAAQWRKANNGNTFPDSEATRQSVCLDDLAAAARGQCGQELAMLSRKIDPRYRWDDIVLPPDQMDQLREICSQAENRHVVYGEWGFEKKLSLGKGLNVLFCGPPGTGKTMAAEVIAHELHWTFTA